MVSKCNKLIENDLIRFTRLDSIPKYYHYFEEKNESTKAVLVTELLGKPLCDLWYDFNPFSAVTLLRIGLQVVSYDFIVFFS